MSTGVGGAEPGVEPRDRERSGLSGLSRRASRKLAGAPYFPHPNNGTDLVSENPPSYTMPGGGVKRGGWGLGGDRSHL